MIPTLYVHSIFWIKDGCLQSLRMAFVIFLQMGVFIYFIYFILFIFLFIYM